MCGKGGMQGGGGGLCMTGGHAWQGGVHGRGACMAGGVHGRGGHAWQGGMHGRRHVW